MRSLKATLSIALALSFTTTIRGFAAEDPLMKETQGLFEPVPSEAPAFILQTAGIWLTTSPRCMPGL